MCPFPPAQQRQQHTAGGVPLSFHRHAHRGELGAAVQDGSTIIVELKATAQIFGSRAFGQRLTLLSAVVILPSAAAILPRLPSVHQSDLAC